MVIGMREDAGRRMASGHIAKNTGMAQRVRKRAWFGHPSRTHNMSGGELNEGGRLLFPFTVALTAANT